jgi:hypothetical protein
MVLPEINADGSRGRCRFRKDVKFLNLLEIPGIWILGRADDEKSRKAIQERGKDERVVKERR